MQHKIRIVTMALLGSFALAMLSGVLLPSDNAVYAVEPPRFDADTTARSVDENTPPGVNIGDPISATDMDEEDLEFGNTLTYSLEGTDAASFDIDPWTGTAHHQGPAGRGDEKQLLGDGDGGRWRNPRHNLHNLHAGRDDHGHGRERASSGAISADGGVGGG